jgi:pilus assembly protein CpaB
MKQQWVLIVAVIAGIVAFWLTAQYLRAERQRIMGEAKQIYVVVAAADLPAGSVLKKDDLRKDLRYQSAVGNRAVLPDVVQEIIGKKLAFNIRRGDTILWSDVGEFLEAESGLAPMINDKMRAISISVDAVSSVSGMIKPNNHVDVLGTFSFPSATLTGEVETVTLIVLQDVTVLATGQQLARKGAFSLTGNRAEPATRGYSTVTLEVSPREAELLVFAQTVKGRLFLALRNPNDVSFVPDMPKINFEHLQKKLPELNLIRQRDIRHKKDL